jgi:hypothetical protein
MSLESGARIFEDDDKSSIREKASSETRTMNSLIDNVEASCCDACLCQQAVAIIGVNQDTFVLDERRRDALLYKLGLAQEVVGEAGHIMDLRRRTRSPSDMWCTTSPI